MAQQGWEDFLRLGEGPPPVRVDLRMYIGGPMAGSLAPSTAPHHDHHAVPMPPPDKYIPPADGMPKPYVTYGEFTYERRSISLDMENEVVYWCDPGMPQAEGDEQAWPHIVSLVARGVGERPPSMRRDMMYTPEDFEFAKRFMSDGDISKAAAEIFDSIERGLGEDLKGMFSGGRSERSGMTQFLRDMQASQKEALKDLAAQSRHAKEAAYDRAVARGEAAPRAGGRCQTCGLVGERGTKCGRGGCRGRVS